MSVCNLSDFIPYNVDAALIISPENRRYLTGFYSSSGFLLITRQGSIFLTDSRYIEAAKRSILCCDVIEVNKAFEQIAQYLKSKSCNSVALEAEKITVSQRDRISKAISSIEIVTDCTLDNKIISSRSVKSSQEIECIKTAQAITDDAFSYILNHIKLGKTERDIAIEIEYYMLKQGAHAISFETIVVSGENSSMPHGVPSSRQLKKGDFITLDFGAVYNGYHSDMTRTVIIGQPTDEQEKIYNLVLEAQKNCLDILKSGITGKEADDAARNTLEKEGFLEFFRHSTGHGVGIEIHEEPRVAATNNEPLVSGNVITVEPGIYLPYKFGVRIEDLVVINDDGYTNLTNSPKHLMILN